MVYKWAMTSWGKAEGFLLAVSKGGQPFELINRVTSCQIRITRVSSNTCVLIGVNLISNLIGTVDADFHSALKITLKKHESIMFCVTEFHCSAQFLNAKYPHPRLKIAL